jgi:hypothetical protein
MRQKIARPFFPYLVDKRARETARIESFETHLLCILVKNVFLLNEPIGELV